MNEDRIERLVSLMADDPTEENQDAFFAAVLAGNLGLRVYELPPEIRAKQVTLEQDLPMRVWTTQGPDGSTMLLAFCNVPEWYRAHPDWMFAEMEGRAVLEMSLQNGSAGLIVQNRFGSWAGIMRDDVLTLLQTKP